MFSFVLCSAAVQIWLPEKDKRQMSVKRRADIFQGITCFHKQLKRPLQVSE